MTDELDSAQYDRSSMPPDPTMMIAHQTEVDYLRRSPVRRFCGFIDGIVDMPPSVHPDHQFDLHFLSFLTTGFHARHSVGVIQFGLTVLELRDDCLLGPDLFVLPLGTKARIREEGFCRPPVSLVVEIVAP